MAGKIQNEDIKSVTELTGAGATAASLPNDDKIYVTANTINKTLKQAIIDGDIGGGGSSKNYFPNTASSGQSTSGFNAFADAAASLPVDGTGGSPSGNLILASSASSPLSGAYSFTLTKSNSVSTQGEGYSRDFTIDPSDKGKVLAFTMNYGIVSGTYADNDLIIYFYDVTNGALLEPTPYKIKNHGLVSDRFFCELQVPYNCTTLRWIIYQSSATTQNYQIKIDDLLFGPQAKLYGSVTTDPIAYTPVFTGFGTVSGVNFKSWRVGKFLYVEGTFTAGTPTATEGRITLGFAGASGNVTTVSTLPTLSRAGDFNRDAASTTFFSHGTILQEASKSYMTLGLESSTTDGLTKQNGDALVAASDLVSIQARFEIEGWSSSQLLSNDAATRPVVSSMTGSGFTSTASTNTKATFTTTSEDSHGSISSSTFTAPVSGYYDVSANLTFNAASWTATQRLILYARINGVDYEINRKTITTTASQVIEVSGSKLGFRLNAGQTVEIRVLGEVSVTAIDGNFGIAQRQGPAQIAASEKIKAKYTSDAGQSIPNATYTIINFEDKEYDTHGSVTTGGSWKFTAPRAGFLKVHSLVVWAAATFTTTGDQILELWKNGVFHGTIDFWRIEAGGAFNQPRLEGTYELEVIAGDYVDLRIYQNESSARSLTTSTQRVRVEIELE